MKSNIHICVKSKIVKLLNIHILAGQKYIIKKNIHFYSIDYKSDKPVYKIIDYNTNKEVGVVYGTFIDEHFNTLEEERENKLNSLFN